jgi:hypothetical protein
MFTKFVLISIIQLYFYQTSFCVRVGHEVGGTSMDSTHYDRRVSQQQCLTNKQIKEQPQSIHWYNFKSSLSSTNNSNGSYLIPLQRQLVITNGEDRLVTRTSSNTINVNNRAPLGVDEATVDVIIDKQVRILV